MVLTPATALALDGEVIPFPSIRLHHASKHASARHAAHGTHVVSEDVFRSVLFRECRRAERSNGVFVLLLVTLEGSNAPGQWRQAIAALSSRRETDVVGWFERGRTIGVILPEAGASHAPAARRAIEDRVRKELAERLDSASMARVSIRAHFHPASPEDEAEPMPADALPGGRRVAADLLKRGLDIIGSAALLALFAPVLLIIAALVKLTSPGPIFFRQRRIGRGSKDFTMLKFRTMYTNSDSAIHREYVNAFIKASGNGGGAAMRKMAHDPRITSVGRVLRKTSLDELPQFINTLRGDMSLVGPRPPLPYEVEQYKAWHRRRVLDAKPGITGLWQVNGRSRTTFDDMVRLDLRYAKAPSVWTDIKILLATPRAVISGNGAG
ncbi:MAG TPA: sugar transferase [Vicinamibacterales bacterium]|nr:sugar transferase [Vicinamibacterales bacterium]